MRRETVLVTIINLYRKIYRFYLENAKLNQKVSLKSMSVIFCIIDLIREFSDAPSQSKCTKGPQVGRKAIDHLFGEGLDPRKQNVLLVRSQVLSNLQYKEKTTNT